MSEQLTISDDYRTYDHGEIDFNRDGCETKVDAKVELVISSEHRTEFKEKLEALIKEYAI